MAAREAQVGARLRFESGQALLTVGSQPAIERAASKLAKLAIRQLDRLASELARELPSFCRTQAWVGSLRDYPVYRIMPSRPGRAVGFPFNGVVGPIERSA